MAIPPPPSRTAMNNMATFRATRLLARPPTRLSSHTTTPPKTTLLTLQALYHRRTPIVMTTAHDHPTASAACAAGVDAILIGDSLATIALGRPDTLDLSLPEMALHAASVASAAGHRAFLIADLPMGSYEASPADAVRAALHLVRRGRVHAVKLEGGADMAPTLARVVAAGVPVLAHVGLTPQRMHALGGFRVQGKTRAAACRVLRDAEAVQAAGAWGVVLEAVPPAVAALVTRRLRIPSIGIGAGPACSGQVLVQADLTGASPPTTEKRAAPAFVKRFGDVWGEAHRAIAAYRDEVRAGTYPAAEHTYGMPAEEWDEFRRAVGEPENP